MIAARAIANLLPRVGARNRFVWRRGALPDEWVAVITWPAMAAQPGRRATYTMRRWP